MNLNQRMRSLSDSEVATMLSPVPKQIGQIYRNIADTHFSERRTVVERFPNAQRFMIVVLYLFSRLRNSN
jgi:hypothetical protein